MITLQRGAKLVAGSALALVRRDLVREIDSGRHQAGGRGAASARLKKWILQARLERARLMRDDAAIEAAQFALWGGPVSDAYYDRFLARHTDWFLGPHQQMVDALVAEVERMGLTHLVEVGCGDGRALAHCAARMPGLARLTGIDINASIVARNAERYAALPRVEFLHADAAKWFDRTAAPGMALMTYGGVMEYFTAADLSAIFARLAATGRAAVALVEPVDPAHDLERDEGSHVFGVENSFSHNHAALLRASGFRLAFRKEISLGGVRRMMIVATTGAGDDR